MKTLKATTTDGIIYTGFLFEPEIKSETIIIHIHGMSGDMYIDTFQLPMQTEYPKHGIAYLAGENRGTHSITQFETPSGQLKNLGNSYEIFEDCILDIQAWVDKAKEMGYKNIWLQGHSLGTSKIAYYLAQTKTQDIKGLILLSPSDMLGLVQYESSGKKDHEICAAEAQLLISQNKNDQLLSHNLWGEMKLSANTYMNFFGDKSSLGIFNYSISDLGWQLVNTLSVPVIAFTGTNDVGIAPVIDPDQAMIILEKELVNSPQKKSIVFKDGDHSFTNLGDQIVDYTLSFIKQCNLTILTNR